MEPTQRSFRTERKNPSTDQPQGVLEENLYQQINHYLQEFEWIPAQSTPEYAKIIQEIFSRVRRETDLISRNENSLRSTLPEEIREKVDAQVFFVPSTVQWIYSTQVADAMMALVRRGIDFHYHFVQRAVRAVMRKFSGSLRRLGMSPEEVHEELWSTTIEDVVRVMTDTSARIWIREREFPLQFPPEQHRGGRKGFSLRVALTPNGRLLAVYHSDTSVTLWSIETQEQIHSWNLQPIVDEMAEIRKDPGPVALFFSTKEQKLAVEWKNRCVVCLSLTDLDQPAALYQEDELEDFIQQFGVPWMPDREIANVKHFAFHSGDTPLDARKYLHSVYDWTYDAKSKLIATASEIDRTMPQWLRDIGFEKGVYVIIKRRLIDMIRKKSNTGYACWRCGWQMSSPTATQCSNCGSDFTRCPIQCPIPPSEPLSSENQWTCPHCGCPSKVQEIRGKLIEEDLYGDIHSREQEWKREHDLDRIKSVLDKRTVTYRKRQIAYNQVLDLKAKGLTNEEIGVELGIPRGSVDYIWNQCRQEILNHFGEY